MKFQYRYYLMSFDEKECGFELNIDVDFPDVEIIKINEKKEIVSKEYKKISKDTMDKVFCFLKKQKRNLVKSNSWVVDTTDGKLNEHYFYIEFQDWNREIYTYDLGTLFNYENIKVSKEKKYLYDLIIEIGKILENDIKFTLNNIE